MIKIYFAGKEIPVPDVIYRNNINSPNNPINTLDESSVNINLLYMIPSRVCNKDISNNHVLEECICSSKDLFDYGCRCNWIKRNKQ